MLAIIECLIKATVDRTATIVVEIRFRIPGLFSVRVVTHPALRASRYNCFLKTWTQIRVPSAKPEVNSCSGTYNPLFLFLHPKEKKRGRYGLRKKDSTSRGGGDVKCLQFLLTLWSLHGRVFFLRRWSDSVLCGFCLTRWKMLETRNLITIK